MNYLFLIVGLSAALSKEEKVFNKLEKSYSKSVEKGYELANKYEKRDKSLASPYYFQMLYFEQKSMTVNKLTNRATAIENAISNSVLFERKATETLLSTTKWVDKKASLELKVIDCLTKLSADKNELRFTRLKEKALKLYDEIPIEYDEVIPVENDRTEESVEKLVVIESANTSQSTELQTASLLSMAKIDFSKTPTGKENIASNNQAEENKIIQLINKERFAKKLPLLTIDPDLVRAARYHAADMANENYFDHQSHNKVNGRLTTTLDAFERIRLFYSSFANTENIAAGNASAEATYQQWFTSPGHYANMFNEAATKVGIAVIYNAESEYGYYWVFCTGTN